MTKIFFKETSTGFMIQKIGKTLDYGKIILKGTFQTKSFFLLNQAELYKKIMFHPRYIINFIDCNHSFEMQD